MDKYSEDLENYKEQLYCTCCGEDSKDAFIFSRTVSNGEVWWCKNCLQETMTDKKPNEDNY